MTDLILANGFTDALFGVPGIVGMVVLALLGTVLGYASRYKRCPSNKVRDLYRDK